MNFDIGWLWVWKSRSNYFHFSAFCNQVFRFQVLISIWIYSRMVVALCNHFQWMKVIYISVKILDFSCPFLPHRISLDFLTIERSERVKKFEAWEAKQAQAVQVHIVVQIFYVFRICNVEKSEINLRNFGWALLPSHHLLRIGNSVVRELQFKKFDNQQATFCRKVCGWF